MDEFPFPKMGDSSVFREVNSVILSLSDARTWKVSCLIISPWGEKTPGWAGMPGGVSWDAGRIFGISIVQTMWREQRLLSENGSKWPWIRRASLIYKNGVKRWISRNESFTQGWLEFLLTRKKVGKNQEFSEVPCHRGSRKVECVFKCRSMMLHWW